MEETAAAAAAPAPNAATPAPSEPTGTAPVDGASADPTAVVDDEHDSKDVVLRRYFLQEWELVAAILRRIVAAGGVAEPADVHRIRSIVSDLELAVALLEKCHTMSSATALRQESTGEMETKCVVLLWLYILVLIPFDISTVDTSIATTDSVDGAEVVPLVTRILDIFVLLFIFSFMEWAHKMLLSVTDDFVGQFRSIGIVEALASIFKIGNRRALYDAVSGNWDDCSVVMKTNVSARSPLLRKFLVKLAQRIALISLPPRSPSWRYKVLNLLLLENRIILQSRLNSKSYANPGKLFTKCIYVNHSYSSSCANCFNPMQSISSSLGANLSSSTAGEVYSSGSNEQSNIDQTNMCPLEEDMDVTEVVEEVIDLLLTGLRDSALHYDVRRGPHSIGSHVNCRRAASAAFQENVGRQGTFPHGIDIVNTTDYFALASRPNSYLNVAVSVAQYKEYLYPFADELLCNKITHWEKSLRELAAQALPLLVQYDMDYFGGHALEKLVPCTLSLDLCTRHGATLAAGEVALKLYQLGFTFSTDMQRALSGIVPAIEKARLYRGKGGEIMRSAVSRFISCISIAGISLNEKIKKSLLETLNENLRHPNSQIQCAAVDALKHFIPTYLVSSGEKIGNDIVAKYVALLDDPNVAARRGAALALGILPYKFLILKWMPVMSKLCSSCTIEDKPDDPDAEARVNSVRGLISVCETLAASFDQSSNSGDSVYAYIKDYVIRALFRALDDYAVDNRGDVGSWVREAAMDALERCTFILCRRDIVALSIAPASGHESELSEMEINASSTAQRLFDSGIAQDLVAGIAKQAVEKIDKMREIAIKTLQRILYHQEHLIPFIPHRELLEEIIPNSTDLEWAVPTVSYPRLVKLLQVSCYSKSVLSGLVISTGGLQESLKKASTSALVGYLEDSDINTNCEGKSKEYLLSCDLLWVLQRYQKCDRVITPTLKTIEALSSKKVFLNREGNSEFYSKLVDSVGSELKGSKDFTKLCAGLSILGYISSQSDGTCTKAFSQLLTFLGHRYPKIRKAAADQVYLVLLQNDDLIPSENMYKAQELLAETCWEGGVDEARRKRSEINEMAGFRVPTSLKPENQETRRTADAQSSVSTDENKSYSSLVDFSGY
ncbi:Tubulin-folding cofactor D [Dichanthelium oligosanthes]|uniref:Tubulin-folding cofactor D n=1 Tax=Dichanthelium oligosanthes TaxID=888268 RepID=A0A1E5VY53_9POAL|nr:Tubulin-folding cofactor D [Dichanthelium oligosanthes]